MSTRVLRTTATLADVFPHVPSPFETGERVLRSQETELGACVCIFTGSSAPTAMRPTDVTSRFVPRLSNEHKPTLYKKPALASSHVLYLRQ
jgi:hypothetical protein